VSAVVVTVAHPDPPSSVRTPLYDPCMEARQRWWTHWPLMVLIGVMVVFGVAIVVVPRDSTVGRLTLVLWGAIPSSIALWQYSYSHLESHRLRVNRARLWLANPEVSWALDVELQVSDADAGLTAAAAAISDQMLATDVALANESQRFVTQFHGVTLRVVPDRFETAGEATEVLRLEIPSSSRSWRGWKTFVDRDVPLLLEAVNRAVAPVEQKLVVDIRFARENPYFGLFVRQVPEASLIRFDVEYFEHPDRTGAVVRVHRDKVQIVTDSIQSGRLLSLQYLALEPVGAHP
jgi:hypothetical protein